MVTNTTVFPLKATKTTIFEASLESAALLVREVAANSLGKAVEDIPYAFVANKQHLRIWAQKGGGDLKLPAIALQISSIRSPDSSYNAFAMRHLGFGDLSLGDESQKHITKYNLRPLEVICVIRFVCQNYKDVLSFSQGWISQLKRSFILEGADGFQIGIGLRTERNMDVPELEVDDIGPLFNIETSATILTFTGDVQTMPTIQSIKTTLYLVSGEGEPQKDMSIITDRTGSFREMS